MAKLNVEVVTPERRLVQAQADEVIVPGADGLFGVRPGHTAFLSLLQAGQLTVKTGTKDEQYFVAGGFVEAGPQVVRVLADAAEAVSGIDVAATKKRIGELEEKLKAFEPADSRGDELRGRLAVERKRLEVAGKK